jgi:hypothetical protein
MRRCLVAAATLLAAALPASAESWGVNENPSQLKSGQWMCMLWYGKSAPMMNITRMSDRSFISVAAPQFAEVEDGAEARITYASGRGGSARLRKMADRPEMVFVYFTDLASPEILDQFRTAGTFTLTSGEVSASFPVPGLDGAIAYLNACVEKFPEAERE